MPSATELLAAVAAAGNAVVDCDDRAARRALIMCLLVPLVSFYAGLIAAEEVNDVEA
ncbi:MAG TPA: hypothetical protein VH519_08435 [Hyphomicrobiaceae bacterium]|jgi:hypothetical protein